MRTVYLAFGSNVDPVANAKRALDGLAEAVEVRAVSTVYRTPALKRPDDPDFLNAVIAIGTDHDPHALKQDVLLALEDEAGRSRDGDPYAPRPLDLDVVLDGETCIDDDVLQLPDPDIYERWFVAQPLHELAGDRELPDTGRRLATVLEDLEQGEATAQPELTDELRARIEAPRAEAGGASTERSQR